MGRYNPTYKSYVYMHTRLDKNVVFYIGVGSSVNHRRAKDTYKRSDIWKRVHAKTPIAINIVLDDLSHKDANSWEKYLIGLYGKVVNGNGTLVNLADGGDGVVGHKFTEEQRKNMKGMRGMKHTEESKLKNKLHKSKPVIQMTRDGHFVREWICAYDAAKELFNGTGNGKIGDCCNGKRKTHKNFTWKYKLV